MSVVRMGVVGVGGMGSATARWIKTGQAPGLELAAVCDVAPDRLEWAKKEFGDRVKRYDRAESLFAARAVDAIYIGTPHYFHPPIAIQAFKAGLHVLTEKPAGVYTRQVREMNEAAKKSGKVFGIMYQMRCSPTYQKVRELVQSGEIGRMQRVTWVLTNWFRTQSYYNSGGWRATWVGEGGGVLINQCPHNLDIWQWICGMPRRIRGFCAFGKYHRIEVEDEFTAYAEYENGATGVALSTTGESPGTNRLEIAGDRGKLVLENGKINFWRTRESVAKFCRESPHSFAEPECWPCEVPVRGQSEEHVGILKNFFAAIDHGEKLIAPGEDGIRGLSISNAIHLSAWSDDWVDLPVDEKRYLAELQKRIKSSKTRKKGGKKGGPADISSSWK
jgi:predicted dehydrogenase